ncbi:MAG: phosphotransferase family protein [Candidatus Heimdallarchaeota archaeon]|nr:phosphotransferase family protein [Candidatus Heimdallarchaeota archaeon]
MVDDTIDVRQDEKFDNNKLAKYLKGKLPGTQNIDDLQVRQFGGGVANLTYLLKYNEFEYVLRRPPLGKIAKSSHDMGREHSVLSVLYKSFSKVPQSYHFCDDTSVIGAPFFIMERKQGIVIRKEFPNQYQNHQNAARELSEALIDALVDLHQVDYKKLGLEELGRPEGFISRQIEGWYKRWKRAKIEDNQLMDATYQWLRENIPQVSRFSLLHNDYKLDNMMFNPEDPSDIVSIFDWDMCTLGDSFSDLGGLLAYWTEISDPIHFKAIAMMPTGDHGFLTRQELVKRYEEKSGFKIENINFYHALGLFRLVVIVAQIYIRFVNKQTEDTRFGELGKLIPLIIRAAHEITQKDN